MAATPWTPWMQWGSSLSPFAPKVEALLALGLWGVPSYCLRDASGEALFCTWGQDRLWRIEAEIRARRAAQGSRS